MGRQQGSSPALFVGTTAFEVIIKQQIKRIEEPSLKCASLVYDELMRILNQLLSKNVSRFAVYRYCATPIVLSFPGRIQALPSSPRPILRDRSELLPQVDDPDEQARDRPRLVHPLSHSLSPSSSL
jgi:replication fork clamp-binding protein CrfC